MPASAPLSPPPALLHAQQAFGLALLQQVAQASPQTNVFLSPLGVATALMLVLEGSAGATREAIAATLRVAKLPPDQLTAAVAGQLTGLTRQAPGQPTFCLANGLWADQRFPLNPDFAARLRAQYQAEVTTLDLAAPTTADLINAWASQHTQGKITDIVTPGMLAHVPLTLANAVYFQGFWQSEFQEGMTEPDFFYLADGTRQLVPLMRQYSQQFGYLAGDGWQAVRLPYAGYPHSASMQVFVPDLPTGLPALLASMSADNWHRWQADFTRGEPVEVDLTLPRFRLEEKYDLTTALQAMGLGQALLPGADFAPMGLPPGAAGFIGQVAHKVYLNVDEQGTEAAAITMMAIGGCARQPAPPRQVTVRADRPFFCAIVDDETGTVLFSGAVYKP